MTIKKVIITIKSRKEFFEEGRKFFSELDKGIFRKHTPTISFENFEIYMRTLTPKRLELLRVVKSKNPKTIKELSLLAQRDFKNVYQDIQLLKRYDLLKLKRTPLGLTPIISYDRIELDIKIPLTA